MTSLRRYATWATASFASMVLNLRFIVIPCPLLVAGNACGGTTPVRQVSPAVAYKDEGWRTARRVQRSHRGVMFITGQIRGRRGTDCSRVAPASRRLRAGALFAREQMPARRQRYIIGPATRRLSSHL